MAETIRINNETLSFSRIYYLDAENGVDAPGGGTKENPYKTFQYLHNITPLSGGFAAGQAIFFKEGEYTLDSGAGLAYGSHKTLPHLIGETGGKVTITAARNTAWHAAYSLFDNHMVINIILKHGSWANSNSYLFAGHGTRVYNSVIYNWVRGYRVVTWGPFFIENSIVRIGINFHRGVASTKNSVYVSGIQNLGGNLLLSQVTLDSDYNILTNNWQNQAVGDIPNPHIGVYGGMYAWNAFPAIQDFLVEYDNSYTVSAKIQNDERKVRYKLFVNNDHIY